MSPNAKIFTERLNHCLDESGAPASMRERSVILSRMVDIPRHSAFSMLDGHQLPAKDTLEKIATEFEVDADWLAGDK